MNSNEDEAKFAIAAERRGSHQQEHHRKETFLDEYRRLLQEAGIEFDEKYLE
jgi:hypothetical protein